MFDSGARYKTCGVDHEIPLEMQLILWEMIDELKTKIEKLDYLQVFELKTKYDADGKKKQNIRHFQEEPPYESVTVLEYDAPLDQKIYVIDDETHSTMLLAQEY